MNLYLPGALLEEVLSLLPARTLALTRRVNHHWRWRVSYATHLRYSRKDRLSQRAIDWLFDDLEKSPPPMSHTTMKLFCMVVYGDLDQGQHIFILQRDETDDSCSYHGASPWYDAMVTWMDDDSWRHTVNGEEVLISYVSRVPKGASHRSRSLAAMFTAGFCSLRF